MADSVNYPDILGAITGSKRLNIDVVQAALTIRPRVVRAGRPFEVILILQNASDVDVDVVTTLSLPDVDAKKQRGRFVTRTTRLVIGMSPAEVGYVVLPASALPDTAVGDDYRVAVELEPKKMGRPLRIRATEGGGTVVRELLPPEALEKIDALKTLDYSISKRLGRNIMEAPFAIMPGKASETTDLKPGWISICKLTDYRDSRPMLARYGDTLLIDILPNLKRNVMYPLLYQTTSARFAEAGYPLQNPEIALIAKVLTLMLEFAMPVETGHGYLLAGRFAIKPLLENDPMKLPDTTLIPHWCVALLSLMEKEPRVKDQPGLVVQRLVYDDLLRDAVEYGYALIETATGEDFGTSEEQAADADSLVAALKAKTGLHFARVYLPLVMTGILVNDQMPASKESPVELLSQITRVVESRREELDEDDDRLPLYDLTNTLIDRTGQKYGFRTKE